MAVDLRRSVLALSARQAPQARWSVLQFLAWCQALDEEQRAQAAATLARAYLAGRLCAGLSGCEKLRGFERLETLMEDAEVCLAALAQEASFEVRRALAETLAAAPLAPRSIVIALAHDESCIGAAVVLQSPLLTVAELVELAATGDERIQIALAQRSDLPDCVAELLVESGRRAVVAALLGNCAASLTKSALRKIADQFIGDGDMRQRLLLRFDLPASVRYDLVKATFRDPTLSLRSPDLRHRAEQMAHIVSERDLLRTSRNRGVEEVREVVRHLRVNGALTMNFIIRCLASGNRTFFEAAAVELSGLPPTRALALARGDLGAGFEALYRRMGLPRQYLRPTRTALRALDEIGGGNSGCISPEIISRILRDCDKAAAPECGYLIALLRRLETESLLDAGHDCAKRAAAHYYVTTADDPETEVLAIEEAFWIENAEGSPTAHIYEEVCSQNSDLLYEEVA